MFFEVYDWFVYFVKTSQGLEVLYTWQIFTFILNKIYKQILSVVHFLSVTIRVVNIFLNITGVY